MTSISPSVSLRDLSKCSAQKRTLRVSNADPQISVYKANKRECKILKQLRCQVSQKGGMNYLKKKSTYLISLHFPILMELRDYGNTLIFRFLVPILVGICLCCFLNVCHFCELLASEPQAMGRGRNYSATES